jgi:hypothetical protein
MTDPRGTYTQRHLYILLLLTGLLLATYGVNVYAAEPWRILGPGLEMGEFSHRQGDVSGPATIFILRIDPKLWDLKILTSTEFDHKGGLSAKSWAQQHNLTAVINAGMFFTDHSTHAGYMKVDKQIASRGVNRYQSFAVFSPYKSGMAPFRIIDRDSKGVSLNRLRKQYRYLVQNLRLIKHPGINRWQPKGRRWNEAALGEDSRGRALFIYSSNFLSVYQLNEALLRLPIDLVAAQHLEGGSQAQMFIHHENYEREFSSVFKPNFIGQQMRIDSWPIPNVIGIVPAAKR